MHLFQTNLMPTLELLEQQPPNFEPCSGETKSPFDEVSFILPGPGPAINKLHTTPIAAQYIISGLNGEKKFEKN
jgi:hypothetical protein